MPAQRRTFRKRITGQLWWIIALFFTCSMVTGFMGFQEYFSQVRSKVAEDNIKKMRLEMHGTKEFGNVDYQIKLTEEPKEMHLDTFDSLYATLQLIIMESGGRSASVPEEGTTIPPKLQFARFAVPLFSILALIKFLMTIAQEQLTLAKIRWRYKGHVIVCGLGDKGVALIRCKLSPQRRQPIHLWSIPGVVAIESNPNNSEIENMRELGAIVLIGDAADMGMLEKAGINKAEKIYALTGSDEVNLSIAKSAHQSLCQQRKKDQKVIEFYTHVMDPELSTYIMAHSIFSDPGDRFNARLFNSSQVTAQYLLENDRLKLSSGFNKASEQAPHVLLIGYGVFGKQLLLQFAQYCHYPAPKKLRVTVVDKSVGCRNNFLNKYDFINDYLDLDFHEGTGAENLQGDLYVGINSKHPVSAICIAVGNQTTSIEISTVLKRFQFFSQKPLIIVSSKSTINELLNLQDTGNAAVYLSSRNVHFVDIVASACDYLETTEEENDKIAKRIHEIYCQIRKEENNEESRTDPACCKWKLLDEMYKQSNRDQARDNKLKLGVFGLTAAPTPEKPDESAQTEFKLHAESFAIMEKNRWMLTKLLDGWKYGKNKDKIKRLHPDLQKWELLDEDIRKRNRKIASAMPVYFEAVGKSIYRLP